MLDEQGKEIDAVAIGPPDHRHATRARLHVVRQTRLQMGARVACEIFWSDEIGEVREVHAWQSLPRWP